MRPNLPLLGPKYGKQLGALRQALSAADQLAVARAARNGAAGDAGRFHAAAPTNCWSMSQEREGFNVAEDGELLVALDTDTDARTAGRRVWRATSCAASRTRARPPACASRTPSASSTTPTPRQRPPLQAHAAYIQSETLAREFTAGEPTAEAYSEDAKVGKERVVVGVTRVGSLLEER